MRSQAERTQALLKLIPRAAKLNENDFVTKNNAVFWIGNRDGRFLSRPICPHCHSRFTYLVVVDVPSVHKWTWEEWRCGLRQCQYIFNDRHLLQRHTACTSCCGRGVLISGDCHHCNGKGWTRIWVGQSFLCSLTMDIHLAYLCVLSVVVMAGWWQE